MKKFIVLDVETSRANGISVYDLGYIVTDIKGNIYEQQSLFISDIALEEKGNTLVLSDEILKSHFAHKVKDFYFKGVLKGDWQLVTFKEAFNRFNKSIEQFKIKEVYAYNMGFDYRHLQNTSAGLLGHEFFPNNLKIKCIWAFASNTICNNRNYFKWCEANNKITECGNIRTNAETVFGYLNNDPKYVEPHTGLEDCKIELQILQACKKRKRKEDSAIKTDCWRIPNKKYKAWKKK